MNNLGSFLIICFLMASCQEEKPSDPKPAKSKEKAPASQADADFSLQKFDSTLIAPEKICTIKPSEFINLYGSVHSIPIDSTERLIIVQHLKKHGFEITGWGRGNFMEGPRIVSISMKNGNCKVRIDKLYYSTDTIGSFRVTERILLVKE